jgi:acetate---CoA ligase (ADP-forming)
MSPPGHPAAAPAVPPRTPAPLSSMLEARSVAVVGASARPGSFGEQLMLQLVRGGYQGRLHPVNPRWPEVLGLPCHPSLADLPEPVDLAILAVSNAQLEAQLHAAAEAGAASTVLFASGYERPTQGVPPLTERLRAVARQAGMVMCGPNGMGFLNLERRLRACGFPHPDDLRPGPITFVTHSGSAFSALLHNRRGLRFNLVVSSGLELVTSAAAYLDHALDLDSTRVVALFLETLREPVAFRAALAKAAARDVPVVGLTVGRGERGRAMVAAHTGALAGSDAAWEALFDAYGAHRVRSLDELADTLELFAAGRRAGPGGLATVHDSGGERAHLVDLAEEGGVPLPPISQTTRRRLATVLEEGLEPGNPLDAWGTGNDSERIFLDAMGALAEDPATAMVALCVDLTTEPLPGTGYPSVALAAAGGTTKPVVVLANLTSGIDARDAAIVRGGGVPVLEGTATGLAAIRHLLDHRDLRARPPVQPPPPTRAGTRARWRARLRDGTPLSEVEGLALLSDYGVPVVPAAPAASVEEAVTAARRLGWPVALKTAVPGIGHKTEAGGVWLDLATPNELRAAYRDLAEHLGPRVTVAAMARPGVELALGVVADPQLGSLVMVAAGGTLVEVLHDRRFALPPLDEHRARALLDRLALRPLLRGVRGRDTAPVDLGAVAAALVRLGALACELGDLLAALDVNPLIAGPHGCVAVDALVLPAAATPPAPTPPAARAGDGHGARAKAARRRSRAR